jgi:hypothetical protein
LRRSGPYLLFLLGVLPFLLLLGAVAYQLDSRLEEISTLVDSTPPRSYRPPNLDGYQAEDISLEELSEGQLIYVPAYSHIYYQGGSPYLLETTLSVRNIDCDSEVYLNSIQYIDTNGKVIKEYIDRLIRLAPMATIEFLVERRDSSGGSGANFLVEWRSRDEIDGPHVESVMVGTAGTQGICFSRTGIEIKKPED